MAISPKLIESNIIEESKIFENSIDQQLLKISHNRNPIIINWPSSMNDYHFQVIRLNYLKAGWKDVKSGHDQREGDWLEFYR